MSIEYVSQTEPQGLLLSTVFAREAVARDGRFRQLDETLSVTAESLTYCQNLNFFQLAEKNKNVSAIITTALLASEPCSKGLVISADPRRTFFELYVRQEQAELPGREMEYGRGDGCRIHPAAIVSPYTRLGHRVEIGPNAVVESSSVIHDDVYIGPNAIVGAEGLITIRFDDGRLMRIKHRGGVEIGRGTEILAGTIVAKSLFQSPTRIAEHCQVGIMANIGHGVSIGPRSVISGNCVVAGRVSVGADVWVGASASIAQGLRIGDGAQIKMGAVVISEVGAEKVVSGNFAAPHRATMLEHLRVRSL